jgi:peroxiredoxin
MKTRIFLISLLTLLLSTAIFAQTSLKSLEGQSINVQGQHEKVVILSVGARWVPLSTRQADFTNQLAKKYAGKNVVVYFVSTDSATAGSKNFASDDDLRKFVAANKLSVPVLRDPDGAIILKRFDIDQIPSFVVLDRSGALVGEPFGGIDPKSDITILIGRAVDRLL